MTALDPTRQPDSILATSQLLAEHRNETSQLQGAINRLSAAAAHPWCVVCVGLGATGWIAGNSVAIAFRMHPLDEPPFFWLQGVACLASLVVALLLISTQRRESQLADRRVHLILEIAIQAEQKSAKAIELLEEARRDNPLLKNRDDAEAKIMAVPTNHSNVLGAIRQENS